MFNLLYVIIMDIIGVDFVRKAIMYTYERRVMKKHSLIIVAIVSALVASFVVYSGLQPDSWFQQRTNTTKTSNSAGTTTIAKTAYTSSDTATTAYNKVKTLWLPFRIYRKHRQAVVGHHISSKISKIVVLNWKQHQRVQVLFIKFLVAMRILLPIITW